MRAALATEAAASADERDKSPSPDPFGPCVLASAAAFSVPVSRLNLQATDSALHAGVAN